MNKGVIKLEQLIISVSHSNYLLKSSGTEKYIRELSSVLLQNSIHHLNFFVFHNKYAKLKKMEMVGVILDDKFIGIFQYSQMIQIVKWVENYYGYKLTNIHLQHLKNHDLNILSEFINLLSVPVTLFLHDYFTLCNRETMLNTNHEFCGVSLPNNEKCKMCANKKNGLLHKKIIMDFLCKIKPNIKSVVAPSEFVRKNWIIAYPIFSEFVFVRPHLNLISNDKNSYSHKKVRLAFVGGQLSFKGFEKWKELINIIRDNNIEEYELYYFGTGSESVNSVKNIYVSIAEQGDNAMLNYLKKYQIDCAFVWPSWPETYSYVYYELSAAGVYIITNSGAGNISDEVLENKNGEVFNNYEECLELIMDADNLRNRIHRYQEFGVFHPKKLVINDSLENIVSPLETEGLQIQLTNKFSIRKNYLLTSIYNKKHNLK